MGAFFKLIDLILFFLFLLIAVAAPLIDAQTCLPLPLFPDFLIHLKQWYAREYGDYLFDEKPHFFVGLVWLEFLFQWPLSLINLYGILGSKPWFNTTCLIYGVSAFTSMAAILAELMGSGKASDKLMTMYFVFMGFSFLALLRGLRPSSRKTATSGVTRKRLALGIKKRA